MPLDQGVTLKQNDYGIVTISQLTAGSPADNTRMLRVGDEIIAINGRRFFKRTLLSALGEWRAPHRSSLLFSEVRVWVGG